MSDYVDVILHLPLTAYHVALTVVGFITSLPYPSKGEVFGSVCIFLILYPVRMIAKAVMPEETIARKYKRRKAVPSNHEHQTAASSVSSLFHH